MKGDERNEPTAATGAGTQGRELRIGSGLGTAKGRFRDKPEEQTIEIALLILRCKFE